MKEYTTKKQQEEQNGEGTANKKGPRSISCKIASVVINVLSIVKSETDLEPLARYIPKNKADKKKFRIDFHCKAIHWDCPWDIDDDSNLLKGISDYGYGNWEQIKMDTELGLYDKILPDGDKRPQGKQLQTRVDYLLRLLKKQLDGVVGATKTTGRGRKSKKPLKSKAEVPDYMDDSDSSAKSANDTNVTIESISKKYSKKPDNKTDAKDGKKSGEGDHDHHHHHHHHGKKKKEKRKKGKDKKGGPMHFTAINEPVAISQDGEFEGELPEDVFKECKEKMRPVKRSLKRLDNPEEGLSDRDQVMHTQQCLLKIGDRINECLADMNNPEKIKQWRCYLWNFVSKFTEFDARKLHKLYKHALKKRDMERDKDESSSRVHDKHSKRPHEDGKSNNYNAKRPHIEDSSSNSTWSRVTPTAASHPHGGLTSFHNALPPNTSQVPASSPSDRWQHSSPLDRPQTGDNQPFNRKRYDAGNNSYSRGGGSGQHSHYDHQRYPDHKPHFAGDNRGFNERREGGYPQRDYSHNSFRDPRTSNSRDYRKFTNSDGVYREYPPGRDPHNSASYAQDRKRRSDYFERDPRDPRYRKEQRLEDHHPERH